MHTEPAPLLCLADPVLDVCHTRQWETSKVPVRMGVRPPMPEHFVHPQLHPNEDGNFVTLREPYRILQSRCSCTSDAGLGSLTEMPLM